MAVYKIFPSKDATIYSKNPELNSGLDSILEVSNTTNFSDVFISSAEVARSLVAFDQNEINDIIVNKISGSQWQANLKAFLANATGIVANSKIYVYPISQSWNNGTGKADFDPQVTNGVSWTWVTFPSGAYWASSSFASYVTASYQTSNPGGGTWYTGSVSGTLEFTQSFDTRSEKDLNIIVTNAVNLWQSGSIQNNGFVIKWGSDNEFNPSSSVEPNMKFFSVDTHTIYPPQLEFRWRDYSFNTGSSTNTFITSSNMVATLPNNKGFFISGSVQKFRMNVRPQFPPRTFQTSSFYIQNYYLPTASYYAVKDLDTNEYVVEFDSNYTQISADDQGNYFTIYMNGLEPERYYKLLIQTNINGETIVLDDNYYFKIING